MRSLTLLLFVVFSLAAAPPRYETRKDHDPDGSGKFYLGREIALVMGHEAAGWLERPEREKEENPKKLLKLLDVKEGQTVADVGAGSGYHAVRLAELVGPKGKVLAVDIQQEMLDLIKAKAKEKKINHIEPVLGVVDDPKLPKESVDMILMVDVYHEFSHPYEMTEKMVAALKPGGRLVFVEFKANDPQVPIKPVHTMSERQVIKEMAEFKELKHEKTIDTLPWQNVIVFGKKAEAPPRSEPKPGEERSFEIAKGVKMIFCWIPPGECQLGMPKAELRAWLKAADLPEPIDSILTATQEVRGKYKSTLGFWMSKYAITQEEWTAMMGSNPSHFDGKKDNKANGLATKRFPVENVSWEDCHELLKKLNAKGGVEKVFGKSGKFNLPHEDQWEYACRGGLGNQRAYYWGDALNGDKANCDGRKYPFGTTTKGEHLGRPATAGSYAKVAPHPWGLSDMSGNVMQWCNNKYTNGGLAYVARGGSWDDSAWKCCSAFRNGASPDSRLNEIGCRIIFCLD